MKASHDFTFLARCTKFWHARDAHVPLECAKYKTFQCSSYATMTRTSRREGSWNKGRDFTDVWVIKQQNNHIKRSETLQSDRCHCRQDYFVPTVAHQSRPSPASVPSSARLVMHAEGEKIWVCAYSCDWNIFPRIPWNFEADMSYRFLIKQFFRWVNLYGAPCIGTTLRVARWGTTRMRDSLGQLDTVFTAAA